MSQKKLIKIMNEAEMSIEDLSNISGFDKKYLAKVLMGKIKPIKKTAEKIAYFLGIDARELMERSSCIRYFDDEYCGNGTGINVYDRRETGRVADSIAEWQMNCCACAY